MIKIGLDAGHGLQTNGKQAPNGVKEWTLNDRVRKKVVEYLQPYDVEIVHTDDNEGQNDENLSYRLGKYLLKGVSAFVSIHHNAYTGEWNKATGVEVYTDKNPTAEDVRLANEIYSRLVQNTGLKGRGIKQADFYVINQNQIPAVLVEGGFMDGTKDYTFISSENGVCAYAKAVADGLVAFLNLKAPSINPKTTPELAREVIAGKWGNGEERKQRMKAAGLDYAAVQALVNRILKEEELSKPNKKSDSEMAEEVIKGLWGNGEERKQKLAAAGYSYSSIQSLVNKRMREK